MRQNLPNVNLAPVVMDRGNDPPGGLPLIEPDSTAAVADVDPPQNIWNSRIQTVW